VTSTKQEEIDPTIYTGSAGVVLAMQKYCDMLTNTKADAAASEQDASNALDEVDEAFQSNLDVMQDLLEEGGSET
jgi:tRNA G37 N-methylase TrmD